MFEYLMPHLFLRSYPGTLLADSSRGAVLSRLRMEKPKESPGESLNLVFIGLTQIRIINIGLLECLVWALNVGWGTTWSLPHMPH